MITQELARIQHQHGYLPKDELRRLSQRLSVPLHRLDEVASFFPHYRLTPPPKVRVLVCRDMACHLNGAGACRQALEALSAELGKDMVEIEGVSCLGQCDHAPAVVINGQVYRGKSIDEIRLLAQAAADGRPLTPQQADRQPPGWKIDPYQGQPRYDIVRRLVEAWKADTDADRDRKRRRLGDPILKELETAGLRGMGGAGFPTHRKWATVRQAPGAVRFVVCNGDESEPGTFKDREILRRMPHLLVEGMVVAGLVTGAQQGHCYIRHEYEEEIEALRAAIDQAAAAGICGRQILGSDLQFSLEVMASPGGYICGEESALLEAMEDHRAEPRNKPPFPVFEGLFGKPTVINNVETLSWVPAILTHGGAWYRDQGVRGAAGLRLVSISGDVARPGVYEVPFGQTVGELVFGTAGGMRQGRPLKAIAPSGPSGGFLPAALVVAGLPPVFVQGLAERKLLSPAQATFDVLELPLDLDVMKPFPDFMLGAAFVVYAEPADMVQQALNCVEFYRNESCGKCVPCRLGSQKLVAMIGDLMAGRFDEDLGTFAELCEAMLQASICGLGQVAANPMISVLKYFRQDLQRYLKPAGA